MQPSIGVGRTFGLLQWLAESPLPTMNQRLTEMLDCADLTVPILDLVRRAIPGLRQPALLDWDTDLPAAGLSSMAMVRLMLAVEAAFDIAIPDTDLSPENFRSARALQSLVTRLSGASDRSTSSYGASLSLLS